MAGTACVTLNVKVKLLELLFHSDVQFTHFIRVYRHRHSSGPLLSSPLPTPGIRAADKIRNDVSNLSIHGHHRLFEHFLHRGTRQNESRPVKVDPIGDLRRRKRRGGRGGVCVVAQFKRETCQFVSESRKDRSCLDMYMVI